MKQDSRLSGVLHVLLHMAESEGPATSEVLARAMGTNPVVIRRLMGGLAHAGFVVSAKGHGGGWMPSCPLDQVTLGDIHEALGSPGFLAVGHRDNAPACLVEQAVNKALGTAYKEAEAVLLKHLHSVTLAALAEDFHHRMLATGRGNKEHHHEHQHNHDHTA